jgi:hypothetical protein
VFFWDAFWELTTERSIVDGYTCPIPWTAMNNYCYRHGITDSREFDKFCFIVRSLDTADRDSKQKKIQAQREIAKTKKHPKGRR